MLFGTFIFGGVLISAAIATIQAALVVCAVGMMDGWRGALLGAAWATFGSISIILVLGLSLDLIPLQQLELVVGILVFLAGTRWFFRAGREMRANTTTSPWKPKQKEAQAHHLPTFRLDGLVIAMSAVVIAALNIGMSIVNTANEHHAGGTAIFASFLAVIIIPMAISMSLRSLLTGDDAHFRISVAVAVCILGLVWGAQGIGLQWVSPATFIAILVGGTIIALLTWKRKRENSYPPL